MSETIYIGADHAGFEHKVALTNYLKANHYQVKDLGTFTTASTDYPDYAHKVAQAVAQNLGKGILICGSGNGMAMTANKYLKVRAALGWNLETATLARQHNDANLLCLPARFISAAEALKIGLNFLKTNFEGGRHERRVAKIALKNSHLKP